MGGGDGKYDIGVPRLYLYKDGLVRYIRATIPDIFDSTWFFPQIYDSKVQLEAGRLEQHVGSPDKLRGQQECRVSW